MPEGSWARFDKQYKDENKCRDLFAKYMWPNGVECTKCGHKNGTNQLIEISDRKINATFKCEKCHKIFEIQTNCILTGSPVPFYDWLRAIFRIAIKTNSTSSHSMPDEIDVIQDSGWKLFLRIGELAKQNILLENQIEMEKSYNKYNLEGFVKRFYDEKNGEYFEAIYRAQKNNTWKKYNARNEKNTADIMDPLVEDDGLIVMLFYSAVD